MKRKTIAKQKMTTTMKISHAQLDRRQQQRHSRQPVTRGEGCGGKIEAGVDVTRTEQNAPL
jgi:hypothetical protein